MAVISAWKAEEKIAHIHGWDFSRIDGTIHRFLLVAQKKKDTLRSAS